MSAPLNSDSPLVAPIEEAKQGIQTLAMFHYQSLLEAGYSVQHAKEQVANLLEQQYYRFCEQGNIPAKTLGTAEAKLTKAMEQIRELAKTNPTLRTVYNDLLSVQSQMKR